MMKPIVIPCGHSFCNTCMERIVEGPLAHRKCPKCRRLVESHESLAVNQALKDLLGSLDAKCKLEGCSWRGKTEDFLSVHYPECRFVREPCPFQNCVATVARTNMASHKDVCLRRPVSCTSCEEVVPFQELGTHGQTKCEGREVQCPFYEKKEEMHFVRK